MSDAAFAGSNHARALWHPMSNPKADPAPELLTLVSGVGCHVVDDRGRRYLDCTAGMWCVNVGYGRREIVEAIARQAEKLSYASIFGNQANEPSEALAERLIRLLAPEDMAQVLFSSGGSDAVETAIKVVRQYWMLQGLAGKVKILSLRNGYHGLHMGGTSATAHPQWRAAYEPLLPQFHQVESPDLYRNPWTQDPEELGRIAAARLEQELIYQGPERVAAVMLEPVQGAGGGVVVPPTNFWPLVRAICDRHDVLLVADEVITGFGRTGSLFGARHWGVKPDVITLAKGINSGYVPLGATALGRRIADAWPGQHAQSVLAHGYTYSGHPVACAAALANLDIVEAEDLPANAAEIGTYFIGRLRELADYPTVGDVRGLGLMLAVELVADRAGKTPFAPYAPYLGQLRAALLADGLLVRVNGGRLIFSPPLVFTRDYVDNAVEALHRAFRATARTD